MATYRQIQARVKAVAGFVPKTSWIADVKEAHSLVGRVAHNRQSQNGRVYSCPQERRFAIEAALRHFGMLAS